MQWLPYVSAATAQHTALLPPITAAAVQCHCSMRAGHLQMTHAGLHIHQAMHRVLASCVFFAANLFDRKA
jgi:hypothetical protein